MSGSPGRDYSRRSTGCGSGRQYKDRWEPSYNINSPTSSNRRERSPLPPSRGPRSDRRDDRHTRKGSRDSRSPDGRRRPTREPSDSSVAPAPPPTMPAPGSAPPESRQTAKSNPLPAPSSVNSSNAEITPEDQAEAGSAIARTLSGVFALLSNDNINTMLLMSEKKTLEESQTDVKNVQLKQESGPYVGKYPIIEARQKRINDEFNKKHKSICAKLEERQVSLRKNCDQIASKIVPDILNGCTKMLLQREDTKSKELFDRLSKKCIALEAELEEQKKSLENVKNLTTNLVDTSHSQMTNSESVIEEQKSELEIIRKQCSALGQRVVSTASELEGVRKRFSELGKRVDGTESTLQQSEHTLSSYPKFEKKVEEIGSTLSKLESQQNKVEEEAAREKTKSQEAFNDFKKEVRNQITKRKSATPQPSMQQTLDDASELSKRVKALETGNIALSSAVKTLESENEEKSMKMQAFTDNIGELLESQILDSNKFENLMNTVATKEELKEVQTHVESCQSKALEKLKERIFALEKSPDRSSPNTESLNIKNLAAELGLVKKDIERLEAQSKEVQRSTAAQSPPEPAINNFETALEDLRLTMDDSFEASEKVFGGQVNSLMKMCKETKADIDQLKDNLTAQTLGANLHALEGRVDEVDTLLNSVRTEHGQKLDSINESISYLTNQSQANARAVMNLDSRYNNITTVDIYKGMCDAFAQDMFPKVDQLYESVTRLQSRTQVLESAVLGSNTPKQAESIGEIQLRLGELEVALQANSSVIEKNRTDLKDDMEVYNQLMASQYAILAGKINTGQNINSTPSGVVNGSSKKRLHTDSQKPPQPNGQHKRARVADSEDGQNELD